MLHATLDQVLDTQHAAQLVCTVISCSNEVLHTNILCMGLLGMP